MMENEKLKEENNTLRQENYRLKVEIENLKIRLKVERDKIAAEALESFNRKLREEYNLPPQKERDLAE